MQYIRATNSAFAAVRSDGHVVTWGSRLHGGDTYTVQDDKKPQLRVGFPSKSELNCSLKPFQEVL